MVLNRKRLVTSSLIRTYFIHNSRVDYSFIYLDLNKMLGKSNKYSPKWWFDGDLLWYKAIQGKVELLQHLFAEKFDQLELTVEIPVDNGRHLQMRTAAKNNKPPPKKTP